jgi:hypothetical protein
VTAIWQDDGTGWALLPLAGSPRLVMVGREVQLGSGWGDLMALEPSGRVVLIENKLARNAEARHAVVAQVLTYAAYLYGMSPAALERVCSGAIRESAVTTRWPAP